MSKPQDSLSPSGSIGKAAGGHLHRTPSRESLNAHPLLANTPVVHSTSSNSSLKTETPPKYVPYTPRHRAPTSSATTGTSNLPASSSPVHQPGHANATSMLHMQNMKAAAQSIGVGAGTVGWAILEKLTDAESGAEWDDIWSIFITVKPTLLLPLEPYSGEIITPELVKDHIVFWGNLNPSFVTYSGLMGTLESGALTFQSSMDTNSATFVNLLKPDHQNSALSSLPPLDVFKYNTHELPSFALPEHTAIQIHPRLNKPPLPPRPSATTATTKPSGTRIVNPFASLFGRPSSSSSTNRPTSPSPSISSYTDETPTQPPPSCIEVRAYSVGKKIVKSSILSQLAKIYNNELKMRLRQCPQRVKNQIHDFVAPFVQHKSLAQTSRKNKTLPSLTSSMDGKALSDAFQTLYDMIRDNLAKPADFSGEESDDESSTGAFSEDRLIVILDEVEKTLCELFYDRLFCPVGGDDISHDDALANRIAGLNMLDLGLEHLGVEMPNKKVQASALEVVRTCGTILQKLEDVEYRSPAKKASLFIEAHKCIVDGLSRLPKLRLKPEGEELDLQLPPITSEKTSTASGSLTPPEMVVTEFSDAKGVPNGNDEKHTEINQDDAVKEDLPEQPTTVSGDVLFPFLIYSVVKANPPRFVSHILFTERFRSPNAKGEEKYCLINLMAVVEFLEHVDMAALGLGESDRVMSTAELSPIALTHRSADLNSTKTLGRRVNQQVGELAELAGSAGKMVTGVVDTSFGVLRGFLGTNPDSAFQVDTAEITPWSMVKPSFGLLRRVSIRGPKAPSGGHEEELVEVASRPGSIRGSDINDDDENEIEESSDEDEPEIDTRDTRSIRSFSSMMSKESKAERATLADRLAKMSANVVKRESKTVSSTTITVENTIPQITNTKLKIPPPNQRFLECDEHDLRIGEVTELLHEYRRVVQAMRTAGLFEGPA